MTSIDFENPPFNLRAAGLQRARSLGMYLSERDYVSFPAHDATYAHLRQGLLHPKLDSLLASEYKRGVYQNQKLMIEAGVDGKNVIATTATGSGKSLGFMVPAFNQILTDPAARVIAFYPLRALGQDQIGKWFRMAQDLELDPKLVQRIDGSVYPTETRFKKLRDARIILVTPDVMHAWFMGALDRPEVRDFLKDTRLKIIDEVQAYNGVFGTNALYLFRRMDMLQSLLTPNYDPAKHRQYIGASGTLPDAVANFKRLTDVDAIHVGAEDNGAPRHAQHILSGKGFAANLADFLRYCVNTDTHQILVFAPSRKKVESLTQEVRAALNDRYEDIESAVIPYKAGLDPSAYEKHHHLINSGQARVVIATSALESGIDVDFGGGIRLGLPDSKSDLLQEMGRVGRRKESFFVIDTSYGDPIHRPSLAEYFRDEPLGRPILYPLNANLQLAAAICLRDEVAKASENNPQLQKAHSFQWPSGFREAYKKSADPWGLCEPHQRVFIPPKGMRKRPQQHLPLRGQPSERFTLTESFGPKKHIPLGEVSAESAVQEYTPGAITFHNGRKFRVSEWKQPEGAPSEILLTPYSGPNSTHVICSRSVSTSLTENKIIGGEIRTVPQTNLFEKGFLAYMAMSARVTASSFLEYAKNPKGGGFIFVRPYRYYDDHQLAALRKIEKSNQVDYGPRVHINYDTVGVVLHIPRRWFGAEAREFLGEAILDVYCQKNGISREDVDFSSRQSSVYVAGNNRISKRLLVFFERGGSRIGLLEELPGQMRQILMTMTGEIKDPEKPLEKKLRPLPQSQVQNLIQFVTATRKMPQDVLKEAIKEYGETPVVLPEGYVPVLAPHTLAQYARTAAVSETVRILAPAMGPENQLGYWVQPINRTKFYANRGSWITVSRETIGRMSDADAKRKTERGETSVVNRFLAATHITSDHARARMAMNTASGEFFNVIVDPESHEVSLSPYHTQDDATRSLLERKVPRKAATPR